MLVCYLKILMVNYMNETQLIELIKREIQKYYNQNDNMVTENKNTIFILGDDLILEEELKKKFIISNSSKRVVISQLNINELVTLSLGTYENEKSKKILEAILERKEIFLIKDGIQWRNYKNIPKALENKYLKDEEILKSYGIKIVKRLELLEELSEKQNYFTGKLLDLKQLKVNLDISSKSIIVSKDTKITELAKEYADINNIQIIKR